MDICKVCGSVISGSYYRLGSKMICGSCNQRIVAAAAETKTSDLPKGIAFALAAACGGVLLRALFELFMTPAEASAGMLGMFFRWFVLALVATLIVVAANKGSRGKGGAVLQICAVLLTYLAITLGLLPVIMVQNPNLPRNLAAIWAVGLLCLKLPFLSVVKNPIAITGLIAIAVCLGMAWQGTARKYPSIEGPFDAALSDADRRIAKS